ncbi:hypothetical protein ACFL07_08430 [Pseudomonadota bacterium]
MTRMVLALIFTSLFGLLTTATLSADVLLIEEVRQSGRMEVPENGMKTADVRGRFGEPAKVHAAVGDPPITEWEYDHWSVYFEYDLVLFTVLHKGEVIDKKSE